MTLLSIKLHNGEQQCGGVPEAGLTHTTPGRKNDPTQKEHGVDYQAGNDRAA